MNMSDCILSLVFSINQKGFLQNYLISVVLQCYDVSITHIMLQCTNCTALHTNLAILNLRSSLAVKTKCRLCQINNK